MNIIIKNTQRQLHNINRTIIHQDSSKSRGFIYSSRFIAIAHTTTNHIPDQKHSQKFSNTFILFFLLYALLFFTLLIVGYNNNAHNIKDIIVHFQPAINGVIAIIHQNISQIYGLYSKFSFLFIKLKIYYKF